MCAMMIGQTKEANVATFACILGGAVLAVLIAAAVISVAALVGFDKAMGEVDDKF